MTTKCDAVLGHAPLAQVALHVSDVDRAETFYRDVLGLTALFRFGDLAFFDMSGVRLLLEGGHEAQPKRDDLGVISQ
ncbi:MAG: VOC family protein [Burkholderiaceae bacterium]